MTIHDYMYIDMILIVSVHMYGLLHNQGATAEHQHERAERRCNIDLI